MPLPFGQIGQHGFPGNESRILTCMRHTWFGFICQYRFIRLTGIDELLGPRMELRAGLGRRRRYSWNRADNATPVEALLPFAHATYAGLQACHVLASCGQNALRLGFDCLIKRLAAGGIGHQIGVVHQQLCPLQEWAGVLVLLK